jgi:hypothetical protein
LRLADAARTGVGVQPHEQRIDEFPRSAIRNFHNRFQRHAQWDDFNPLDASGMNVCSHFQCPGAPGPCWAAQFNARPEQWNPASMLRRVVPRTAKFGPFEQTRHITHSEPGVIAEVNEAKGWSRRSEFHAVSDHKEFFTVFGHSPRRRLYVA